MLFCPNPDCGTQLDPKPQPKHWLFQFNPKIYNWLDRINQTQEPEQWLISQSSKLIHKEDLVAIWSSGQNSGIYALGKIITNPAKNPLNTDQVKYLSKPSFADKFQEKPSAFVEYFKVFVDKPILQEVCNHDSKLLDLQVLINPQRTNFPLTSEQWERIQELTNP